MRVVTWNMACGPRASRYRKHQDEAWKYLVRELSPDVALVQEALVSHLEERRADHWVTLCDLGAGVVARTAVLVHELESKVGPDGLVSPQTYAVTARVRTPAGLLTLASVMVAPSEDSDLTKLAKLLGSVAADGLLVGGNFDAGRRSGRDHGARCEPFYEAMLAAGLHRV